MAEPSALASYIQRRKVTGTSEPSLLAGSAALLAKRLPDMSAVFDRHLAGRTQRTLNIVWSAWEIIVEALESPDGGSKPPEYIESALRRYAKQKMKPGDPFRVSDMVGSLYNQGYRTTTSKPKNIWAKAAERLMMKETEVKNIYYSPAAAQLRKRLGMSAINSKMTKKKNLTPR
jgi:hypothetical protein